MTKKRLFTTTLIFISIVLAGLLWQLSGLIAGRMIWQPETKGSHVTLLDNTFDRFARAELVGFAQRDMPSITVPAYMIHEGACFYISAVNSDGSEESPAEYCLTADDIASVTDNRIDLDAL